MIAGDRLRLDDTTILFALGVVALANGLVLLWAARLAPTQVRGPLFWALASLAFAASCLSPALLPPSAPLRPLLFNLPLVASHALWLAGVLRFCERAPHDLAVIGLAGASALASLWFTAVEPDISLRVALAATASVLLRAATAWVLWNYGQGQVRWVARLATVLLLIESLAIADHGLAGWQGQLAPIGSGATHPRLATWITLLLCAVFSTPLMMLLGVSRLLEDLRRSANQDSLTQLPNRRGFFARIGPLLAHAQRLNRGAAVLMLDIDRFKKLNDAFGHNAGDDVLRAMGRTLTETLRSSDVAVRWGGEEFCALLVGADGSGAHSTANRIRKRFAENCGALPALGGQRVSVSIGIAYGTLAECSFDSLQAQADAALYAAKDAGRDRVVAAAPGARVEPPLTAAQ